MAKVESQKAHRLSEELANIQDKYKDKDKIIRKCKDSKTKKMEKVE